MHYQKAIDIIKTRRRDAENAASRRYETALNDSKFYEAEKKLRAAKLTLLTSKSKANEDKVRKLQKERTTALIRIKLTESDFVPKYICSLCNDTGTDNGKPCKCAKNLAIELSLTNTAAYLKYASFETVNLKIFKETAEQAKMTRLYALMEQFCTKFPTTKFRNILLLGNTGTGKTHIISCIANRLIERGENVLPVTAFELVNRALAYHTTHNSDKLSHLTPLLDSDLLIIDDLGTESILKNVTLEYLYLILNERLVKGKHTIITTNLEPKTLEARYGTRIASRLLDKSSTFVAALGGSDVRKLVVSG
ncbi:MAG: ATP-binding protein [Firmicutes bacterium]|nr:ATP-binding protein [Bacillota bacterium]